MPDIQCTNCRKPYPEEGVPFRCPSCGGIFDYASFPAYQPGLDDPTQPGIWRYRYALGLPVDAPQVSLGEGNTPLVFSAVAGKQVAFKCEHLNPSGSYKDRGAASLISFLVKRGVQAAIEDSSGNAGAAFAAYAAAAGLNARVYIPDSASGPKRKQIAAYGAEVVRILGTRLAVAEKVRQLAAAGAVYASHAYLPFVLPGYATMAYEIVQQLGRAPGTILAPVGQGNMLLAVGRGFKSMLESGHIRQMPRLVGVQAQACAPLWAVASFGRAGLGWVTEGQTVAEGVRVRQPVRGDAVLQMVESTGGNFLAVEEEKILPGRDQLGRQGFYVEPTSALVWDALAQILPDAPEPVVAILTGHGLKSLD